MDLEPIEERANEFATWVGKFDSTHRIPAAFASAADVPALLAEVKRLRAMSVRPAPAWDGAAVRESALKRAYRVRRTPIHEDDAWAFGEGARAGIESTLAAEGGADRG